MKTPNLAAKSLVLLLILLGGLAILAYFYSTAGGRLPLAERPYEVVAVLTESQQVLKHSDVRSAGVKVGEVGDIENVDGKVRLRLELKRKYAPVYRDATILVRQKTLVGENYVDLTAGDARSGAVRDGGTLAVAAQKESVPIDKVLNALDPRTRRTVSRNLRTGGDSLRGRGEDLNELFDRVAPVSEDGSELLDVLNAQRGQIARLVANTGVVLGAFASRTSDLRSLVRSAKVTAEAVAGRDRAVLAAFRALPPALQQVRSTVRRLRSFTGPAKPVIDDLRTSLKTLEPVVAQLRPTAARARRLTDALPALFEATDPALSTLPRFADAGTRAVPGIESDLREVNPIVQYLAPFRKDVTSFMELFSASTFSKWGAMGRCACPVSDQTLSLWTPELRALVAPLLDDDGAPGKELLHETFNPYRKPGTLPNAAIPWDGKIPTVERDDSPNAPVR